MVTFITPVLAAAQEAVVAEIVAASIVEGGFTAKVVVLVLPHASVTRIVCVGDPANGIMLGNTLLAWGPAINVVFVASYTAKVYGPPPLPAGIGPPAVKFCGVVTMICEKYPDPPLQDAVDAPAAGVNAPAAAMVVVVVPVCPH